MMIVMLFHYYYLTILYSTNSKKLYCTKCLKHFKEQKMLQQHRWYCKNEVYFENLIDKQIVTKGYSKHITNSTIERSRRYLKRFDAVEQSKSN